MCAASHGPSSANNNGGMETGAVLTTMVTHVYCNHHHHHHHQARLQEKDEERIVAGEVERCISNNTVVHVWLWFGYGSQWPDGRSARRSWWIVQVRLQPRCSLAPVGQSGTQVAIIVHSTIPCQTADEIRGSNSYIYLLLCKQPGPETVYKAKA